MTSLTIQFPDELAERIEKTGILKSPEILAFIEQKLLETEKIQNIQSRQSLIELLGQPDGIADIDIDFPRSKEIAKPVDLS